MWKSSAGCLPFFFRFQFLNHLSAVRIWSVLNVVCTELGNHCAWKLCYHQRRLITDRPNWELQIWQYFLLCASSFIIDSKYFPYSNSVVHHGWTSQEIAVFRNLRQNQRNRTLLESHSVISIPSLLGNGIPLVETVFTRITRPQW